MNTGSFITFTTEKVILTFLLDLQQTKNVILTLSLLLQQIENVIPTLSQYPYGHRCNVKSCLVFIFGPKIYYLLI